MSYFSYQEEYNFQIMIQVIYYYHSNAQNENRFLDKMPNKSISFFNLF